MSLVLSQNTSLSVKELEGVHLSWTSTISKALQELDLIFFDSQSNTSNKISLNAGATTADVPAEYLVSGRQYFFSLYAVDVDDMVYNSNLYKPTAPYTLSAPQITSVVGINNGVNVSVTFPALKQGESLTGTPKVVFVFLEISNGIEPAIFTVDKPYGLASYLIDSDSNPLMSDDNLYKVSCFIKPDNADTQHPSQSAMSNAVDARPSNLPSAPTILTVAGSSPAIAAGNFPPTGDSSQYQDWSVSWTAPADISYWNRFNNSKIQVQIFIRKENSFSDTPDVTLDNPQTLKYTFTGIDTFNNGVSTTLAGQGIAMKIRYVNDSGAGAFSDLVYYYNYQNVSAVTNLSTNVDSQNQVVNVSWDAPANLAISSAPYQYELVQTKAGVSTTVRDTFQNSIRYGFPYLASEVGASLSYSVVLKSRWVNDSSIILTSPAATTGQVVLFTEPAPLTNCAVEKGDKKLTFYWNRPSVADGLNHTANEAYLVVTQVDTGFSLAIDDAAGGSYILSGLTNGLFYNVDFYSKGTTPAGVVRRSSSKITVENSRPRGDLKAPTNVQVVAGDQSVSISWSEQVGDIVNGNTVESFDLGFRTPDGSIIAVPTFTTLLNSHTFSTSLLANGVLFYPVLLTNYVGEGPSPYFSAPTFIPFGLPQVSNIQFSGKTVTCSFKPNGRAFSGFDIIGLTAVSNILDNILLESTADMSSYSQAITGTVPLSFTFDSISANLAAAILILATEAGTVVGSKGINSSV